MHDGDYQKYRTFTHVQPNHIAPGELSSLLNHIANMSPMQFIVEFEHYYDEGKNETAIRLVTTGEKFPGQFDKPSTPGLPRA